MEGHEKPPIAAGAQDTPCNNGTTNSLAQGGGSDPKLSPGTHYCQCSSCGLYFVNERAFRLHRVRFVCMDPGSRGLVTNRAGYWARPGRELAPQAAASSLLGAFSPEAKPSSPPNTGRAAHG